MKKTIISLVILCIGFFQFLHAQEGLHGGQLISPVPENFFSASPDVAAFQKFNILPVSLYTGKIDLSIPIFEINSGGIRVPISISYNSGGIKVDDIASSVGLGWNLNAGGSVVRTIKDIPDNQVGFSLFNESDYDLGTVLSPILSSYGYNRKGAEDYRNFIAWGPTNRHATYVESPTYTGTSTSFGTFGTLNATKDMSPDIFNANAPGLSSRFTSINTTSNVIYPNNSSGFTSTFLGNSGAKMESLILDRRDIDGVGFYADPNINHHHGRIYHPIKDFFEFNIISNSGIKYKFADEEVSESFLFPLETEYSGFAEWKNTWDTIESNNYNKRVHTWNLSTITDSTTNKNIIFSYDTYSNSNTVVNTFINGHTLVNSGPSTLNINNKCVFKHSSSGIGRTASHEYTGAFENLERHPKRKRLTKITFDKGEVIFIYNHTRLDYLGEKALTEIQVKDYNGVIIKKYRFNYSYFDSKENCSDPECKRLRLDSVDIVATNGEFNSYAFNYDYTNKLPKRGSLQQDYLGYYNNNGVTGNSSETTIYKPTLYYYANQGRYAVLPFQRTNASYQLIPGQIDFTPNSYSLTALLNKVTYPTGGSSEFVYENNTFQFMGATYTSGGARVKSQTLKDGSTVAKQLSYEYKETDGKSSGYLSNIPIYGYLYRFQRSPYAAYQFAVYDKPKGGIELTSGSFVGYSRVLEKELNNGYSEYNYSSPKNDANIPENRIATNGSTTWPTPNSYDCSTSFINNSAYPSITFIDNDYIRGKLNNKFIYSEANNLLKKETYNYTPRTISTLDIQRSVKILAEEISSASDGWDEGQLHILDVSSQIPVAQDLLMHKTTTDYLGGIAKIIDEYYQYDNNYPFLKESKIIDNVSELKVNTLYPFDTEVSTQPYISNLISQNRLSSPIKEEVRKDNMLTLTNQNNFNDFGNGVILPKSISSAKGTSSLEEKAIIDLRDENGNILEYHVKEGIYTLFVYGYNKTYLVAKVVNASYASISTAQQTLIDNVISASIADIDIATENTLIAKLQLLRDGFPSAQVTTQTYNPLIGATSITGPSGNTTYYEYDEFNRLVQIKDADGKILGKNAYHYKE